MAVHTELRPDDASLPLLLADAALRQSNANVTHLSGIITVDNGDGSETWIGGGGDSDDSNAGGVTPWVGDTVPPGRPIGLSAVTTSNHVLVSWDGTLEGGVPSDFDHISVYADNDGTVESWGDLNCAGTVLSQEYEPGTILEIYATAYDNAHDSQGNPSPNASEPSERIVFIVSMDEDMAQLNDAANEMSKKADDLSQKADSMADQITDINGTINGQKTKLKEFDQKLEGVISDNDTTVKSMSELKQTVSGISSKVEQTAQTADAALDKASKIDQTADGIRAEVAEKYQTKDGMSDYSTKSYVDQTASSAALGAIQNYKGEDGSGLATKSEIKASKDEITSTVSSTYQTKDGMRDYVKTSEIKQLNDKVVISFNNSQSVGGQNLLLDTSVPVTVTGSGEANQCFGGKALAVGALRNLSPGSYNIQFKFSSTVAGGTVSPQWANKPYGLGGVPKLDVTTEEQTYSESFYLTDNGYDTSKMQVCLNNVSGDVTIREMKLERGNNASAWSAAPEDSVNDLTNAVQNQADALGNTVDSDTFNKYRDDTDAKLDANGSDLDALNKTLNNEIRSREAYVEFGSDLENPYMRMGTDGNASSLYLTNTELDFMQGNARVAWLSNQRLVVDNSTVNNSLAIGDFVFRYRSNGHLTLQHI